jgi:hypothetical protein
MNAAPHLAGLPQCDVYPCQRLATHLYHDLNETDPVASGKLVPAPDGSYVPELFRQWDIKAHHARCETHQEPARRYYQDGRVFETTEPGAPDREVTCPGSTAC